MSNINQLLAKAMSTTSEEEAMSCLRMARKKGKTFDGESSANISLYKDKDAKYWYERAAHYYYEVKKRDEGLSPAQQTTLYNMYKNAEDEKASARVENYKLRKEIEALKLKKPDGAWKFPLIMFQFVVIIVLLQLIH